MENILLNNGTSVIIGSNRDITETIAEHCSHELASLIESKMNDIDEQKIYAEARAKTDAENYQEELQEMQRLIREMQEVAEGIINHILESKRINKELIYQKAKEIAELKF